VPDTDNEVAIPPELREVLRAARDAGFLGPGPIERHFVHAEGFVRLAQTRPSTSPRPRVLDLGSGGGLPGLVVALQWPVATLVLLEANERRAQFLERSVLACHLEGRVTVVQDRAEIAGHDPAYRGTFDGVVVRSFGPPAVVAECAAPFLKVGGWMIVSEPPGGVPGEPHPRDHNSTTEQQGSVIDDSGRWPREQLAQFGLEPVEFVRGEFGYQILGQRELCPDRFPRRNGIPSKRPLF
jgi:16S rRNA (guanine527-N7)-methyltransferase